MRNTYAVRTYNSVNFFVENGDFYVGPTSNNPTTDSAVYYFKKDGSLYASNIKAASGRISNLFVEDELRALHYNIQTVADLGGTFIVAPTLYCSANATFQVSAINGTTITATINDASSIDSDTLGGATWKANSQIKISGSFGGVVIGTCSGHLTANMNADAGTMKIQFTYDAQSVNSLSVKTYAASEISDLHVMLTTVYDQTDNPVGIYMTSYDANKRSHISLYGGTDTKPTVRIGNLQGLDAINDVTPTGWGIYTNNGFFSGVIVSNSGKIGDFTISDALYSSTHSDYNTNVDGIYIGSDYISFGKQGVTYFKPDGTGKIGAWNVSATAFSNGTYGSDSSVYISTANMASKAIGGRTGSDWRFTVGSHFGVTNTGAFYANSANVAAGTFGSGNNKIIVGNGGTAYSAIRYGMTTLADTTNDGFYIGTDGIALGKGAFRVNADGSAVFKNATLGDPNAYHVSIDSDSLDIWSGVDTTATNRRASFGASGTIIGNDSGYHVSIDNDSLDIWKGTESAATNKKAYFGANETMIGNESGYHMTVGSDGLNIWSGTENTATNKKAYFSATEARIGNANSGNILITPSKLEYADNNGNVYFSVVDARNGETITTHYISETEEYTSSTYEDCPTSIDVSLPYIAQNITDITLVGTQYVNANTERAFTPSYSFTSPSDTITITGLPSTGWNISYYIEYTSKEVLQSFTFGGRSNVSDEYGVRSFSSGYNHYVRGKAAATFGNANTVNGKYAFASGADNVVAGVQSVAFGKSNHVKTGANNCFVAGTGNRIDNQSKMAIALNCYNVATENYQTVIGKYNNYYKESGNAFVIGNGTSDDNRSNAMKVTWSGILEMSNGIFVHAKNVQVNHYTITSNQVSYPIQIKSSDDNTNIGRMYGIRTPDDQYGIGMQACDPWSNSVNSLVLTCDENGSAKVSVTSSSAWRSALGFNRSTQFDKFYTTNSYVNETNFNRIAAYRLGNLVYVTGNLSLSGAMPKSSDWVEIGQIPMTTNVTWYESVAGSGSGSNIPALGIQITTSGVIRLYNYSNTSAPSGTWYRFTAIIPME